jgi:hypothetical protein
VKLLLLLLVLVAGLVLVLRARAADTRPAATVVPGRSMAEIEDAIRKFVRAQGPRPAGEIRVENSEHYGTFQGRVEVGESNRQLVDFASPEFEATQGGQLPLQDLVAELHAASKRSEQGPWYYLIVTFHPEGGVDFEYFLENRPLASIKELRLGEYGYLPKHVFVQRFDAAFVAELSDFEVNAGIAAHVPDRLAKGKPVSPELLDLFATIDWEGDVNNGGMDQYFARRGSDYTGQPRDELHPRVHAGLERIGAHEAAALFRESIALWAHFHPEVESARMAMGIAAVPRQEQSDIGGRYYEFQPDFDRLRAAYVRAHPEILEQS